MGHLESGEGRPHNTVQARTKSMCTSQHWHSTSSCVKCHGEEGQAPPTNFLLQTGLVEAQSTCSANRVAGK